METVVTVLAVLGGIAVLRAVMKRGRGGRTVDRPTPGPGGVTSEVAGVARGDEGRSAPDEADR